jgi:capsid protein
MGAHEMGRNIDAWQWNLFIPRFCDGVFQWFKDALAMQGMATDGITAEWTPPIRTVVDPSKENKAILTAVRAGFMSLPEAIRQMGYDPDTVLEEQQEYFAKLDAAGVLVDSDVRNDISNTGVSNG